MEAFKRPYKDVKAANAMGDYFKDKDIDMVFSPDIGAAGRAKMVGERMGVPYDHLEKKRLSGTEVVIQPAKSDVKGKSVLIVDDMISTGGTIMTATTQLKAAGARKVTVACTHGVYVNNALERLKAFFTLAKTSSQPSLFVWQTAKTSPLSTLSPTFL